MLFLGRVKGLRASNYIKDCGHRPFEEREKRND
jgi:hypothetical protein